MFDTYIKSPENKPLLTLTITDPGMTVYELKELISEKSKSQL